VGTMAMFPFLLLGVFIAHKLRKFEQVFWFLFISLILFVILAYLRGSRDLFVVINGAFIASPILFFTFVMLTEPLTSPPTKFLQSIYGAFIGVIFGFHLASLELALCVGNIFSYLVSPKYRLMLKLKKRNKLANNIYEFVFATSQKVKFKAGQYLEWTMAPTKADDRGNRRYFTVSSSPTEKDVKIGMKFPEAQASTFKKAMLNMKIGDKIVAGQLAGEFTLPKDTKEKLVFIAGGIGVTPYRSIIKYLIDMNEKRDIVFMYSEKTKDSFVYKDIFDEAVKKLGVKVIYFESDVKGHMTSDIIKSEIPDYKKRLFYLSGPHRMVTGFEEILKHLNLPQARIKVDYFPGF
jgi:glycine betaine catabolism B